MEVVKCLDKPLTTEPYPVHVMAFSPLAIVAKVSFLDVCEGSAAPLL